MKVKKILYINIVMNGCIDCYKYINIFKKYDNSKIYLNFVVVLIILDSFKRFYKLCIVVFFSFW